MDFDVSSTWNITTTAALLYISSAASSTMTFSNINLNVPQTIVASSNSNNYFGMVDTISGGTTTISSITITGFSASGF